MVCQKKVRLSPHHATETLPLFNMLVAHKKGQDFEHTIVDPIWIFLTHAHTQLP